MNNPMEAQGRTPAAGDMGSSLPSQAAYAGETPGLFDDPQFPGPVTSGAALGPGVGPEAITPTPEDEARALLKFLPVMERVANQPESSLTFRNLVRHMRSL